MITFEQLFKSIGIEYKRIRLILFYDVVKKCNYENHLSKILSDFKRDNKDIDYMDRIYFQVIYMDSSYFANSLKKFEDEIDILKYNINDINNKYEAANRNYEVTKGKLDEITQKYDGVNDSLRKHEKIFQLLYENMDEKTKKLYMEIKNEN